MISVKVNTPVTPKSWGIVEASAVALIPKLPVVFGDYPNIKGRLSFLPSFGEQAGGLEALYYYAPTQTRMQVAQETANNIPCDPCIDASRSSSLYQDNLTEIKVNALFGLNLIKAF